MLGHFGIGIYGSKTPANVGTLWRTAFSFGANYIFTIGHRYPPQATDTVKSWKQVPLFQFPDFETFDAAMPKDARLVGVELNESAIPLSRLHHPKQAVYLLGAEDDGLPAEVMNQCWKVVQLPGTYCINVAVAGSIVLYDRLVKEE